MSLLESGKQVCEALDELGLKRYCCRRMLITHVNLIETLLKYNSKIFFIQSMNNQVNKINERVNNHYYYEVLHYSKFIIVRFSMIVFVKFYIIRCILIKII